MYLLVLAKRGSQVEEVSLHFMGENLAISTEFAHSSVGTHLFVSFRPLSSYLRFPTVSCEWDSFRFAAVLDISHLQLDKEKLRYFFLGENLEEPFVQLKEKVLNSFRIIQEKPEGGQKFVEAGWGYLELGSLWRGFTTKAKTIESLFKLLKGTFDKMNAWILLPVKLEQKSPEQKKLVLWDKILSEK